MNVVTVIRKARRSFGDDGSVFHSDADFIDWINDAQMQIARETNCLTGVSTAAASTFPVAYPADFIRVRRLTYNGIALSMIAIEELDSKYADLTDQDEPLFYYFVNNTICLFPDPLNSDSKSVVIQYAKTPTDVTLTVDPLTVPIHYHEDVVTWCLAKAHERNENWKGMEAAMTKFNANMSMRVEDFNMPEDTYPVVRDDDYEMWYQ